MDDKLAAAIAAYAEAQSKVLDRVFENIEQTGSPSSADLAFCQPDDVIAGMPEQERYDAFLRKLSFLGYAMWKSSCYRQVREHEAFETERACLTERFPELDHRFQDGVREGRPVPMPTVGPDTPRDIISRAVTGNGCTLFQLQDPPGTDASISSGESRRRHP